MTERGRWWARLLVIVLVGTGVIAAIRTLPVERGYLVERGQAAATASLLQKMVRRQQSLETIVGYLSWLDQALGEGQAAAFVESPEGRGLLRQWIPAAALVEGKWPLIARCQGKRRCAQSIRWEINRAGPFRLLATRERARQVQTKTKRTISPPAVVGSQRVALRLELRFSGEKKGKVKGRGCLLAPGGRPVVGYCREGSGAVSAWWTVLPPLIAIFLVLLTRRILLSLFLSLLFGVTLLQGGNPLYGLYHTAVSYIWSEGIYKEFSINILLFTFSLIGMVNICSRNGGVQGLIDRLSRLASGPRSSRTVTALMGILVFFDDYANSIVVGNTMRPLTDRYRISREKLAYLVDSTAAPIAGVALLSTWIGYEVGLLGDLVRTLGLPASGYGLFLSSIPFRFYCWMTLIFVFLGAILGRDFGPMLQAERRSALEGKLLRDGAVPMVDADVSRVDPPPGVQARWYNALIPIAVVLLAGFVGLLVSGGAFEGKSLRDALAEANNTRVFLVASLIGSAVAFLLSVGQRLLSWRQAGAAWLAGARAMSLAVGILIFAWSMAALSRDLGSAYYLIALLKGTIQPQMVPLLIFLMAAAVAFATGTSWGTMGILIPTATPLAYEMGGMPLLVLSVGAVLDGAIFGDHCSPLSDTTLLSSAASACDHVDHVKTQAPYAITVMLTAALFGYIWVAYGLPHILSLLLALVVFFAVFYLLGRPLPSIDKEVRG